VILALPRGGVPVAAEVAIALHAPLDLILVRKIGVPIQPELAMGAVVDGGAPIIVRNEDVIRLAGIDETEFEAICDSELAEIERRRQRYLGSRERVDVGASNRCARPQTPVSRFSLATHGGPYIGVKRFQTRNSVTSLASTRFSSESALRRLYGAFRVKQGDAFSPSSVLVRSRRASS
jgi:hypothetical protein